MSHAALKSLAPVGALLLLLAWPLPGPAAEPPAPSVLDQAMAAYEQGDLAQARRQFEALARAGQPAAMHNLAVMHLRGELPRADLQQARRLLESAAAGLISLKGHKALGGVRASLYNAMPVAGAQALAGFMQDFQQRHG